MTIRYFAYGANMSAALMRHHGVHFASRVPARLPGFRLEFNVTVPRHPGLGYANIVPDPAGVVEGALYELDDAALAVLDTYEDYPTCYGRQQVTVVLADGRSLLAITYVANPERVRAGLRPSRTYLRHLLAGRDLLSPAYYARVYQTPTEKFTAPETRFPSRRRVC